MQIFEVVPGLMIGTKLAPPVEYEAIGVDAIVDLEEWDFGWAPPVPLGCMYLSFPMEDEEEVNPRVRQIAGIVALLLRSGWRVLVHCTEGLNRSGVVVVRTLIELGWTATDAIDLVRRRRGRSADGFEALSNPRFVEWLLAEEPRNPSAASTPESLLRPESAP